MKSHLDNFFISPMKAWVFFLVILCGYINTNAQEVRGDVNGDYCVNETDITETVSYIMGSPSTHFNEKVADVNNDGIVNIADIVVMIDEHKKYHEITPTLEWETGTAIIKDGYRRFSFVNPSYGISNVIRVYEGDRLLFHGYANPALSSISSSLPILNTYTGSRNYIPFCVPQSSGIMDMYYQVQKDGYIVLCSKVLNNTSGFENKLTIYRTEKCLQTSMNDHELDHWREYGESNDFVPIVDDNNKSGIFTYSADTKVNTDHIANAVAYPNGDIIACRENGAVVKISNDGSETTLLNIPGTHDWRGVYMDKNLNVYVSPHSATFSTHVKQTDRALYRLPYGSNTFEKIIPLFYSPEECGVTINVYSKVSSFIVNSLYYYKDALYRCIESHTKGTSFEESKFLAVKAVWESNTSYVKGDVRMSNGNYWVCKTAHTSGISFDQTKWYPMTACMANDDTIWTMCEDDKGHLYAGVYAHSVRRNPAVYKSTDGGETWTYQYNFVNGCMPVPSYGTHVEGGARHVHCINFNEYNNTLYACVGEVNTLCMSEDYGETWVDLNMPFYYGQPTMVIGAKDGTLIGSDGHYSCGVSKLSMDNKNVKPCGRTCPGFVFAMRRSDVTGWIYAFTRCDNVTGDLLKCPPMEAINDPAVLQAWKENDADAEWLAIWERYHEWASKYYPDDAVRPIHAVIMVSKDEGETWEVIRYEKANSNYASICGFITTGYFRNGECLTGLLKSIDGTEKDKQFVCPIVVSEGVKTIFEDVNNLSDESKEVK